MFFSMGCNWKFFGIRLVMLIFVPALSSGVGEFLL
jgi:hypothetical protein